MLVIPRACATASPWHCEISLTVGNSIENEARVFCRCGYAIKEDALLDKPCTLCMRLYGCYHAHMNVLSIAACTAVVTQSQPITEISPHMLPEPLALGLVVFTLSVLRLLILLASAIPLAMTMRIHMGSRLEPTRVMLSCFTLQGHTQEPCRWAISSRVPISTRTILSGTDMADICHLQSAQLGIITGSTD